MFQPHLGQQRLAFLLELPQHFLWQRAFQPEGDEAGSPLGPKVRQVSAVVTPGEAGHRFRIKEFHGASMRSEASAGEDVNKCHAGLQTAGRSRRYWPAAWIFAGTATRRQECRRYTTPRNAGFPTGDSPTGSRRYAVHTLSRAPSRKSIVISWQGPCRAAGLDLRNERKLKDHEFMKAVGYRLNTDTSRPAQLEPRHPMQFSWMRQIVLLLARVAIPTVQTHAADVPGCRGCPAHL